MKRYWTILLLFVMTLASCGGLEHPPFEGEGGAPENLDVSRQALDCSTYPQPRGPAPFGINGNGPDNIFRIGATEAGNLIPDCLGIVWGHGSVKYNGFLCMGQQSAMWFEGNCRYANAGAITSVSASPAIFSDGQGQRLVINGNCTINVHKGLIFAEYPDVNGYIFNYSWPGGIKAIVAYGPGQHAFDIRGIGPVENRLFSVYNDCPGP